MKVYKDKQYLIFDFEDGRNVKYDFSTKTAIGIKGKPVKNLQGQLSGFTMNKLFDCCVDKQYAKFLKFVQRAETYPIYNIGTILSRVPKYSKFEQIFSAGIEDIIDSHLSFEYTINEIPKSLIKLCKTNKIKISNQLVERYKEIPNAYYIAYDLDYFSLTSEDIQKIWNASSDEYSRELHKYIYYCPFHELVKNFGYNAKDLWLYLDRLKTFEAVENMKNLIIELYDYANMMRKISPKYDKYPRHFLTTHQIACRNYNRMKQEFSEELFQKQINKDYEITYGEYIFIYPKCTQDIKDEAAQMSNCVASYIDKVIDGKCHILFLRKKSNPDESLVTIEVRNNRIVQARRRFNDLVTSEDQKAINYFNKKFGKEKEKAA